MKIIKILLLIFPYSFFSQIQSNQLSNTVQSESKKEKNALRFNINENGSHYFQITFLNQVWLRYNQNNDSSTLFNKYVPSSFDIGLRRTRIQMFGQINDRTFLYFQFGQNNFNDTYNYTSNRKIAAFFHDALCEFKVSNKDQLKIGGGLTILNGLSRFSQPSVSTILTLDVPVFLQYSVDQIDQFDRRLAVYARGQLGNLDYRAYLSNPFPINSNGAAPMAISKNASFINTAAYAPGKSPGVNYQYGYYLSYNFLEKETHSTPYMSGTYLGQKKIFNIATGLVYQKDATWFLSQNKCGAYTDTSLANMLHLSIESFLDMPINKEKGTALSAFAGFYSTNYGQNYLRYNGIMNPATGGTAKNMIQSSAYGNAFPMFGTGKIIYTQFGLLLPKKLIKEQNGQLMPFLSAQYGDLQALQNKPMITIDAGINWLIKNHQSKISIDLQNRPTFLLNSTNDVVAGNRKNSVIIQYQIMF